MRLKVILSISDGVSLQNPSGFHGYLPVNFLPGAMLPIAVIVR